MGEGGQEEEHFEIIVVIFMNLMILLSYLALTSLLSGQQGHVMREEDKKKL